MVNWLPPNKTLPKEKDYVPWEELEGSSAIIDRIIESSTILMEILDES